jgi:hypothetical protein
VAGVRELAGLHRNRIVHAAAPARCDLAMEQPGRQPLLGVFIGKMFIIINL